MNVGIVVNGGIANYKAKFYVKLLVLVLTTRQALYSTLKLCFYCPGSKFDILGKCMLASGSMDP